MMKHLILLTIVAFSGCASMGFTDDVEKLNETVAFDQKCPLEKVKLENRLGNGVGSTKYQLNACGKEVRYIRMGSSYFEEGKTPVNSM